MRHGNESASGIGTARGCLRKWAFRALDGIKEPYTKANADGDEIHDMQAKYLLDGTAPASDYKWHALHHMARKWLPAPGRCIVEQRHESTIDGIRYTWKPDAYFYDEETREVFLFDHKSSKWAPYYCLRTQEDYLNDTQIVTYCRLLLDKYPLATRVRPTWIYYKVPNPDKPDVEYKPKVYTYPQILIAADIMQAWEKNIAPTAGKLVQLRASGLHAKQVPTTVDHCDEYGGCWYRKEKHCTPMTDEVGDGMDDLFADLDGELPETTSKPKAEPKPEKAKASKAKAADKEDLINPPEKASLDKPAAGASTPDTATARKRTGEHSYALFNLAAALAPADVEQALRAIVKAHV